jgi:hypothetical protein
MAEELTLWTPAVAVGIMSRRDGRLVRGRDLRAVAVAVRPATSSSSSRIRAVAMKLSTTKHGCGSFKPHWVYWHSDFTSELDGSEEARVAGELLSMMRQHNQEQSPVLWPPMESLETRAFVEFQQQPSDLVRLVEFGLPSSLMADSILKALSPDGLQVTGVDYPIRLAVRARRTCRVLAIETGTQPKIVFSDGSSRSLNVGAVPLVKPGHLVHEGDPLALFLPPGEYRWSDLRDLDAETKLTMCETLLYETAVFPGEMGWTEGTCLIDDRFTSSLVRHAVQVPGLPIVKWAVDTRPWEQCWNPDLRCFTMVLPLQDWAGTKVRLGNLVIEWPRLTVPVGRPPRRRARR